MSASVRDWLTEHLAPILPEGSRWVDTQRNLDALDAVTVQWKQNRIARLPEAPIGAVRVEGTLTIISPRQDFDAAEAQLDDAVTDLCAAIDGLAGLAWTEATKVAVGEQHIGYDVSIWTTATPAPAPSIPDPAPAPEPDETEE